MYSHCYVRSVLGNLFHCVVLCTVCVYMCTLLLPPGVNLIAVIKYIILKYALTTKERESFL